MVYAVVTLDNVLLYDTEQMTPFASIGSIHYEQLTDASWYDINILNMLYLIKWFYGLNTPIGLNGSLTANIVFYMIFRPQRFIC